MRIGLIAAKQLQVAKTRLMPALPSVVERAALAEAMFRDVLAAALSSRQLDRVAIVTSDPSLITIGRSAGTIVIDEEFPRGLNAAVRFATTQLMLAGATAIATILSDTPLITNDDIDAAFAALPEPPGVVLVPSRDFSGTNVMVRSPGEVIPTEFGRLSLVRHREACQQRHIRYEIIRLMQPAIDIDVPEDLLEFVRTPSITHTYNHLMRLGLAHG